VCVCVRTFHQQRLPQPHASNTTLQKNPVRATTVATAAACKRHMFCHAVCCLVMVFLSQGFEIHYATNFLGHFALTQHLLPALLPQKARVVVVSSILHSYAGERCGDLESWRGA
jgi:NAD(P)-dependent dehydrogenase (short-subunit alcohol dehydrogenase family)